MNISIIINSMCIIMLPLIICSITYYVYIALPEQIALRKQTHLHKNIILGSTVTTYDNRSGTIIVTTGQSLILSCPTGEKIAITTAQVAHIADTNRS